MSNCVLMNMCMILNAETKQVLVQDKINSKWSGITFPGGHVDNNESIYESTVREIKEETGLSISDLKQAGIIYMNNPENHDKRLIFLFKTTHFKGKLINETDEGKIYWVSIHKLYDMKLAPNMLEYLELFLNDNLNELYITPALNGNNNFTYL